MLASLASKEDSVTRFIFVRHGQTDWNCENRFRGHADIPLNRVGVEQALLVSAELAAVPLTAIYASPLQRRSRQPSSSPGRTGYRWCPASRSSI